MRVFEGMGAFADFLGAQAKVHPEIIGIASEAAAGMMHGTAKKVFGDVHKLAELADSTQQERAALGYSANEPLLRTGELLRDSVEEFATPGIAAIGSSEPVMMYHEYGYINHRSGNPVPPRPVFKITLEESLPAVESLVAQALAVGLGVHKPTQMHVLPDAGTADSKMPTAAQALANIAMVAGAFHGRGVK